MSESQHSQLSTPEALDKFIEGLLSESETTALTDALQHDPDLDFDLESYGETISLLRTTDLVPPPDMFVWQVQQRIRRRTRGRWFAPPASRTFVLEAAVCAVLFIATVAMYIISMPAPAPPIAGGASTVTLHSADIQFLESRGTIATIGMPILGDALEIAFVIPEGSLETLRADVEANPRLTLTAAPAVTFDGSLMVQIQATSGIQTARF